MAETIASKPWQDVQMDMEDLLASCLSVGQKEIDTIRIQTRTSNSCRDPSSCFEECAAGARLELGEISCMMERDYEHVPSVDWTDVHDRDAPLVPIDDAGFSAAGDDFAEHAVVDRHCSFVVGLADLTYAFPPRRLLIAPADVGCNAVRRCPLTICERSQAPPSR